MQDLAHFGNLNFLASTDALIDRNKMIKDIAVEAELVRPVNFMVLARIRPEDVEMSVVRDYDCYDIR